MFVITPLDTSFSVRIFWLDQCAKKLREHVGNLLDQVLSRIGILLKITLRAEVQRVGASYIERILWAKQPAEPEFL